MSNHKTQNQPPLTGLSQVKETLMRLQQQRQSENIQKDLETSLNFSKQKQSFQSNSKNYNYYPQQLNFSPSYDQKLQNSFTNNNYNNNISSNKYFNLNIDSPNKSILAQKQQNHQIQNPAINSENILQGSNSQQNLKIQNYIALKNNPPQNLNISNSNNNSNLTNIKNNRITASEQMEINWFKTTIDTLCEDNQILQQNIQDALKVINSLKNKLSDQKNTEKQLKNAIEEKTLFQKKLHQEKIQRKNLQALIIKLKHQYQNFRDLVKQCVESDNDREKEDDALIAQLQEENQALRQVLNINFKDDILQKIEKNLENEEGQFFSMYCTKEEKPSEIEIKYMLKRKNSPLNPSKNFKNPTKQLEGNNQSSNQKILPNTNNNTSKQQIGGNAVRGDLTSLSYILGNSFSWIKENMAQQFGQQNDEDFIFVNDNYEDQDQDEEQLPKEISFNKNKQQKMLPAKSDLQKKEEQQQLQSVQNAGQEDFDEEQDQVYKITGNLGDENDEQDLNQEQDQIKSDQNSSKNKNIQNNLEKNFNEIIERQEKVEKNGENQSEIEQLIEKQNKINISDSKTNEIQKLSSSDTNEKDKDSNKKKKNFFLNQKEQEDQEEVEKFLQKMNYKSHMPLNLSKKGYFDIQDESQDLEKAQFFEQNTNYLNNQNNQQSIQELLQKKTIEFEEYEQDEDPNAFYEDQEEEDDDDGLQQQQERPNKLQKMYQQLPNKTQDNRQQNQQKKELNSKQKEIFQSFANFEEKMKKKMSKQKEHKQFQQDL